MNESNQALIIAGVVFVILLVFYIIAKVKSKKDELVLTANGWDMAMLLTCPLAIFVAWFWGYDHPLNTAQTVCMVIAGACLAGTCIMSIVSNPGDIGHVLTSILAKLFIVWLTLLAMFLLLLILVGSVVWSMLANHEDSDEYILLKYDRALRAYVGYRAQVRDY